MLNTAACADLSQLQTQAVAALQSWRGLSEESDDRNTSEWTTQKTQILPHAREALLNKCTMTGCKKSGKNWCLFNAFYPQSLSQTHTISKKKAWKSAPLWSGSLDLFWPSESNTNKWLTRNVGCSCIGMQRALGVTLTFVAPHLGGCVTAGTNKNAPTLWLERTKKEEEKQTSDSWIESK